LERTEHEDDENRYGCGDKQFAQIRLNVFGAGPPAAHVNFGACPRFCISPAFTAAWHKASKASTGSDFKKAYKLCLPQFEGWADKECNYGGKYCTWTDDASMKSLMKECAAIFAKVDKDFASQLLNTDDFADSFMTMLHERKVVSKMLCKNPVMIHSDALNAMIQGFLAGHSSGT